jgi:hypothetical protein
VFESDHVGLVSPLAVRVTAGLVPLSTVVPAFRVVMVDVLLPAVVVLVSPVIWIDTRRPALIEADVNEYVSVVPASATLPPAATLAGVTVLTAGVPAVPVGTVMVTELRADVVAVVNPYV